MRIRHAVMVLLFFLSGGVFASQIPETPDPAPTWDASTATPKGFEANPDFDTSYSYSSMSTISGRFDRNADDRVDLVVTDRNGDGKGDYWATDRNFDGITDDYQYDRNFNGKIDQWEYDYDGDGIPDKIFIDANGDGRSEIYAEWNPIARSYAWYGKGGRSNFAPIRSKRRLAAGRAAFSE